MWAIPISYLDFLMNPVLHGFLTETEKIANLGLLDSVRSIQKGALPKTTAAGNKKGKRIHNYVRDKVR